MNLLVALKAAVSVLKNRIQPYKESMTTGGELTTQGNGSTAWPVLGEKINPESKRTKSTWPRGLTMERTEITFLTSPQELDMGISDDENRAATAGSLNSLDGSNKPSQYISSSQGCGVFLPPRSEKKIIQRQSKPRTFYPFQRLSPEIRIRIWQLAIPKGRELVCKRQYKTPSIGANGHWTPRNEALFSIAQTCREARYEALGCVTGSDSTGFWKYEKVALIKLCPEGTTGLFRFHSDILMLEDIDGMCSVASNLVPILFVCMLLTRFLCRYQDHFRHPR
jgi:hypothetical protein